MDSFYIITNNLKDENLKTTLFIRDYLQIKGKRCVYQQEVPQYKAEGYHFTDAAEVPGETDCVIVLGGDGTLIRAARDMNGRDIPILGVNLGTVGYLTEVEQHNIIPALDKLISGAYEIEERMMLTGTVLKQDKKTIDDVALNDIVINRGGPLHIMNFTLYVNGEVLNQYSADGIIVSTPTGSTGYSMSAGGPIIEPTATMIVITPICSHALNNRSIVLASHDEVVIEIGQGRKEEIEKAELSFDGNRLEELETGDRVVINKADKRAKIVKLSKISFLETLRKKISEN